MNLLLVLVPPPQVAEQEDHEPHFPATQSTRWKKLKIMCTKGRNCHIRKMSDEKLWQIPQCLLHTEDLTLQIGRIFEINSEEDG